MKNIFLALFIGLLSCGAMAQSPNDVVQEAADELAAGLEGRKEELAADRDALYVLIDEILLPRFDRRYAAQLVLGKHWRNASDDERKEFIDAFYRSLVRKYGDGALDYDQDNLEILPFRGDDTKKRTTVKTIVRLEDGTKVPEMNAEIQAKGLRAVIDRLNGEQTTASVTE
jgi:phospholipid transport system substrate-binding protein